VAARRVIFDPPLIPCVLRRRYKRFLADVEFDDGERVTVHCPNTGAMTGCAPPDSRAWVSVSTNPARKYRHTLEVVRTPLGDVGINSARANALVAEALAAGAIDALAGYPRFVREVRAPDEQGRFDFLMTGAPPDCYVEVKSMTLALGGGRGAFPDAVSERAKRHVEALERLCKSGCRGVLLFCAQHSAIRCANLAEDIDPDYAAAVRRALASGVEVIAVACAVSAVGIRVTNAIPFSA
jgi:sugar fermentation stimulation protein A